MLVLLPLPAENPSRSFVVTFGKIISAVTIRPRITIVKRRISENTFILPRLYSIDLLDKCRWKPDT
jgi:hypothetical protein